MQLKDNKARKSQELPSLIFEARWRSRRFTLRLAMKDDPIVEEARAAGSAYFARFNHDLDAAFEDLRRQTEELRRSGREVVSLPPRRPQVQSRRRTERDEEL